MKSHDEMVQNPATALPAFHTAARSKRTVAEFEQQDWLLIALLKVLPAFLGSSGKRVPGQLSHKGGRNSEQHRSRDNVIYSTSSVSQQCQSHSSVIAFTTYLPAQRHPREGANPGKVTLQGIIVSGNGKEPGRDDESSRAIQGGEMFTA